MNAKKILVLLIIVLFMGAIFSDTAFAKWNKKSKSSGSHSSSYSSSHSGSSITSKAIKAISKPSKVATGALPKKTKGYAAVVSAGYLIADEVTSNAYVPNRVITFDLGRGIYTIDKVGSNCNYKEDSAGNKLSTASMCYDNELYYASQNGTVVQFTDIDVMDAAGERIDGSISINITTFLNNELIPQDRDKAIRAAINAIKIDGTVEKNIRDATLATGQSIKICTLEVPINDISKTEIDAYAYMPDENTIVTVTATRGKISQLTKTLKIGDLPSDTNSD